MSLLAREGAAVLAHIHTKLIVGNEWEWSFGSRVQVNLLSGPLYCVWGLMNEAAINELHTEVNKEYIVVVVYGS